MLDRLEEILGDRRRRGDEGWIEIYRRTAWVHRVSMREGEMRRHAGREDGVAVRLLHGVPGSVLFGASSGGDAEAVEQAIGLAEPIGRLERPPNQKPGRWTDRDGDGWLPPFDDLERWLDLAPRGTDAWVTVAVTLEVWVSSAGARATRRRTRAWAMVGRRRPLFLASRGWGRPTPDPWREQIEAHTQAEAAPRQAWPGRVVLRPEPSAKLALLLAASLHGTQDTIGTAVGPGWVVSDEPAAPGALFGGDFDDVLDPTQTTRLADQGAIVGDLTGTGHARRASYRDPPQPAPSHLVCQPPNLEAVEGDLVVTGVRIYPAGREWILEVEPGPGWVRTTPSELARRCLGGIGAPKATHRGGAFPSLVFEGLGVRW